MSTPLHLRARSDQLVVDLRRAMTTPGGDLAAAEGNPAGAVTHLKLGARNGLTQAQLSEALAQCFLSLGLIRFNVAGIAAWNAFKELPTEPVR